ncbi:MAG: AsmA family protein [Verrucomicrobiota bacterium]|nr:AsmA family protein [Verrucomicrobiota bacterium]
MGETDQAVGHRRWGRIALVVGGTILLLVGIWQLLTSNYFMQRVVLPMVSRQLNADILVDRIKLRPLKRLLVENLRVQPKGAEPLLEARVVTVEYRWQDLIQGRLTIDTLFVESPRVNLVLDAQGRSNLDPILHALAASKPSPQPQRGTTRGSVFFQLGQAEMRNGIIHVRRLSADAELLELQLAPFDLRITQFGSDQVGRVSLDGEVRLQHASVASSATNRFVARCQTRAAFALGAQLDPVTLQVDAQLHVKQATGPWQAWAHTTLTFATQLESEQLQSLTLQLKRDTEPLATLAAQGVVRWNRREGSLQMQLSDVDARLLSLLGLAKGIDFGQTRISFRSTLLAEHAGRKLSLNGRLSADPFEARKGDLATPSARIEVDLGATLDLDGPSLLLQQLHLVASQGQNRWLEAALSAPLPISWRTNAIMTSDAALRLRMAGLDLAEWKPLLGNVSPSGRIFLDCDLVSQTQEPHLRLRASGQIQDLTVARGTNVWTGLDVGLTAEAALSQSRLWSLTNTRVVISRQRRSVVAAELAGAGDLVQLSDALQLRIVADLPGCQSLAGPAAPLQLDSGQLQLSADVMRRQREVATQVKLDVRELKGRLSNGATFPPELQARFALRADPQILQLSSFSLDLGPAPLPWGRLTAEGIYQYNPMSCSVTARIERLSQAALAPWLEPFMAGLQLHDVEASGRLEASWRRGATSRCIVSVMASKLSLRNGTNAPTPYTSLGLDADVLLRSDELELAHGRILLDAPSAATNELHLQGVLRPLSKGGPWTGQLRFQADNLDLTHLWELWAAVSAGSPPEKPSVTIPSEPAAKSLPLHDCAIQAKLNRVRLRELELREATMDVRVQTNRIFVDPIRFQLNGAPVQLTADCDLSEPGYNYQFNCEARSVPIPPLVAVFAPDRRGQIQGSATLHAALQGKGFTGANLQKHLRGQTTLTVTNLNLSLAQVRSPLLQTILDLVLGLPDLIRNPAAGATHVLSQLLGVSSVRSGWTERLLRAPIDSLHLDARAQDGLIHLATAELRSAAFQARTSGDVHLEADLSRSTLQLPLHLALERSLAEQIGQRADPQADFVALPDFVTIRGTLGAPKAELNKVVLVQLAAAGGANIIRNMGKATTDQAGKVLQTLGQILGPQPPGSATNAPAQTNTVPTLLDLLRPPSR